MTRKHTKRKVYALRDPISYAISGVRTFRSVTAAVDVEIANHASMTALTQGTATKYDLQVLSNVVNMCIALGKQGFAEVHEDDFQEAKDAIVSIVARAKKLCRVVATGPEINALNWVMQVHDAQLGVVSVSEIERANRYIQDTVRSGGADMLKLQEVPV